jgi:hypothetical protein
MRQQRQDQVSQPTSSVIRDGWNSTRRGEPRLEELMEDPIMGLLWQRDGLEPSRARQTLCELRAIVRAGREAVVEAA